MRIVLDHGDQVSGLLVHGDVPLVDGQRVAWVQLCGAQGGVEVPQVVDKPRPRDGEHVPVQPRQVIRKPEPRRGWDNTARCQEASRMQVDAMYGRGLLA